MFFKFIPWKFDEQRIENNTKWDAIRYRTWNWILMYDWFVRHNFSGEGRWGAYCEVNP